MPVGTQPAEDLFINVSSYDKFTARLFLIDPLKKKNFNWPEFPKKVSMSL